MGRPTTEALIREARELTRRLEAAALVEDVRRTRSVLREIQRLLRPSAQPADGADAEASSTSMQTCPPITRVG